MENKVLESGRRAYQGRLNNWDGRASVRNTERRLLQNEERFQLPFSPNLVPIVRHPIVTNREPSVAYDLLAQRLYTYLEFTDQLETEAVVPACLNLARKELGGLRVDAAMAFDGRRIATDEMYHAQCAADLTAQIIDQIGVIPVVRSRPFFLTELERILIETPREMRLLSRLAFVIVSETLITNILRGVPKDKEVMPTVRDVIRDHAQDEARHHAYFADVLHVVWPQLTTQQKDVIGQQLPLFIAAFLKPDLAAHIDWLQSVGLEAKAAEEIIEDTYPESQIVADIEEMAAPTIRHFEQVGILDYSAAREALEAFGFTALEQAGTAP